MFGESDTESPRLNSPWEAFSTSPSPCPGLASSLSSSVSSSDIEAELARRLQTEVPRLVPEIEEGNVEYKLKLSPSPERLTRLITQLKWRLLEGGGQALYEIGVGDNGQLIGLPRREMEGSLDALERMAGELGATVMILREIVVPSVAAARGEDRGRNADLDADPNLLPTPAFSRSTSTSASGSGDDELEAFPLELDGEDGKPTTWTAHAHLPNAIHTPNWPNKSNRRGSKPPQKAEHKKVRRAVKKSVNAAFATGMGTSPNSRLDRMPGNLDAGVVTSAVPSALGVPDVVVEAPLPEVVEIPLVDLDTVTVPFDPASKSPIPPNPDEVIIVEALVVRKLALEEAFLDFGGFSVLG